MANHFLRAFDIIDKDHSGVLDVDELRRFMIENNYERHFVEKFLKIFDMDGDKTITREEYMEALGFIPNKEQPKDSTDARRFVNGLRSGSGTDDDCSIPKDVKILRSHMTKREQAVAINYAVQHLDHRMSNNETAGIIKKFLDLHLGRIWQVVVGTGPFASHISNEENYMLMFEWHRIAVLIWRTPEY